ncbi:MAG TPA: FtsX-like permease family protein [Solirubrobacteraceae bacterium]|nr:FtsX-like permease family protein [Solirubrobacteraceae bacterium]
MRPANLLRLYRVRLRARLWQECFAIVGIAAGVALLFAAQVSNSSLQSAVASLSRGIAGNATLQLLARDPHGFPQGTLALARRVPGVHVAAPLLEAQASVSGPQGSRSVLLVGADAGLSELGGALVRHNATLSPFGRIGAVVLPAPLARAIGVTAFGSEAAFRVAGRTTLAPLYAQLGRRQIGTLTDSPVAVVPLSFAQEMTGLHARVSRILVQPAAGAEARVQAGLRRLARGRLDVEPIGHDEVLFAKAAAASNQSTQLFAVISALVGFLFAFNAMLFTVPQRRRLVLDLRREGYSAKTVLSVLALDALVLGLIACTLGLVLGQELSIHVFHSNPAFLSLAFAFGSQRAVSWQSLAIAGSGGMLAAIAAVLVPLRELLARRDRPAAPLGRSAVGSSLSAGRLSLAGLACLLAASAILLAMPRWAIAGMVLIVASLLLELPIALSLTLALVKRVAGAATGAAPHLAVMELGNARGRALAIAMTGALAVFGSVAVRGAHDDLLAGLERSARETNAPADVWVQPTGSYDLFQTAPFAPTAQARLAALPGVRAVRLYRGGLLDYGERRVLVTAPPSQASPLLAAGQLLQGSPSLTSARLRSGGWLVLSQALAEEHHLRIGQAFTLPSPDPRRFRVAALSTNLGWAPGAVIMNASDYAHAWDSADASAYEIELDRGVNPARGVRAVQHALGGDSGLVAETAARHAAQQIALSRQALQRLTQIATLILIAAVLAMTAAMGAMVWQRRPRLARLKLDGLSRGAVWRTILLESGLLLGVGCATGAVFGLYGRQLADRALAEAVNFPIVHSASAPAILAALGLMIAAALAILAIPSYLAARAPATLALQD